MVRRLPSQPPVLPGFSYLRVLGSGGFADVFLYEQNMPRRQVAVKVMLAEVVNEHVRQMFQAEANLMAQLSSHPSILTVYQASVSSDGRPYIVMELCSATLTERYRRERIPVPEVLRIAVKIGSAVETAHRAGVLHRDIKPSNILMTAYGHPVLADFGIASTLSESSQQEVVGMSIPWSAPEVLMDEIPGSVASEVWAFAATVYSLLAGRSPFELPGQENTSSDLIGRINKAKPQAIDRADVPASLERALRRAMSRRVEDRPASVLELVNELQSVESELGVAQTPIEVAMDDWALATVSDLEDRTRVRGADAAVGTPRGRRRRRGSSAAGSAAVGTLIRPEGAAARSTGTQPVAPSRRVQAFAWVLVGCLVVVIALAALAIPVLLDQGSDDIPVVADIEAQRSGDTVLFSWADPGLRPEDSYQVTLSGGESSFQRDEQFRVDADPTERVCIDIRVNREGETGRASGEKCADAAE